MAKHIPFRAQIVSIVLAGGWNNEYLNGRWIPGLLALLPGRWRRIVALYLLSLSRHYFDWSAIHAPGRSKVDALEAEYARNMYERESISRLIVQPRVDPTMTVVDFGCGPGFLASAVCKSVKRLIGIDISLGALACARILNDAPNIDYIPIKSGDLFSIPGDSVDLIYSFAVFYHLTDAQKTATLHQFARILKPGGTALVHFALPNEGPGADGTAPGYRRGPLARFRPLYEPITTSTLLIEAEGANLALEETFSIAENWVIEDKQIGCEHLAVLSKPERR